MSCAMLRMQYFVDRTFDVARNIALRCSMPRESLSADFGPGARGFGNEVKLGLLRRLYKGNAGRTKSSRFCHPQELYWKGK